MPGCDAFADDNGVFEIEVRSYATGKVLGTVRVENLEPMEPIDVETIVGQDR